MNSIYQSKSYQDVPESLTMLCLRVITTRPKLLNTYPLPPELGQLISEAFRHYALRNKLTTLQCDEFFHHFKQEYIPIKRINFSYLPVSEELLFSFLSEYQDKLDEIDISNSSSLSNIHLAMFNKILKSGHRTSSKLIIGNAFSPRDHDERLSFCEGLELKKLVIHGIQSKKLADASINKRLSFLTPTLCQSLRYIDLSLCTIGQGTVLVKLQNLETLILFNCAMIYPDIITNICELKKLRVLDLSREALENDESVIVPKDSKLLNLLVSNLPDLDELDISGTNLVGVKHGGISAFEKRSERPFKFLGLFRTGSDAAFRIGIPALTIAGDATEKQILNACEAYMDRPIQLARALHELYHIYKTITPSESFRDVDRALNVTVPILTKHIHIEQIVLSATAALWCIIKYSVTSRCLAHPKMRRIITSRLLDALYYHHNCRPILINGALTLLFMPDIVCEHARIAKISLLMCGDSDPRIQGFGTTILNTLACQVGGNQRVFIGDLNAIKIMIDIIQMKIKEDTCDDVLEAAWSTLWNITDETPVNCKRFLEYNGLEVFESCMDKFHHNKEVLKNIMGLLGNIVECETLREHFMNENYIKRFFLLLSSHEGLECSYNACGILAHLISEGEDFWNTHLPKLERSLILKRMRLTIASWQVNSPRNINYRSFEPIVRLLDLGIAAESQYWAVFALANLTRINPSKYCQMLEPHDGLVKLHNLAVPSATEPYVYHLVKVVLYQYERFMSEGTLGGLELCDSVDWETIRNFHAEASQTGDGTIEMNEF